DLIVEGSETLTVTLTPQNPSQVNLVASDLQATGTITDNDTNTFSVADVSVDEAAGTMTFTVVQSGSSEVPIAFNWSTADGTAVAGQDYTAVVGGTVTVAAGTNGSQTSRLSSALDLIVEGSETL